MKETIISSYELQGHSVALSQASDGLFSVKVKQAGVPVRIAGRYENRTEAGERFSKCCESVRLLTGKRAA